MLRRDFFKGALASLAAIVVAPFLPKTKASTISYNTPWTRMPMRIGTTINIRKPMRYVVQQTERDLKAVTGIYEPSLEDK